MELLLGSHLQESARRAAGSFLSPLTNAIGEQRRLVESLAVVSKVRVEECKHMMIWSKAQTDDLGDVLLKLNLLIRKISDYEIRFGTQYDSFREKIKYLRTKDDSLCEMGRRQTDLQNKILDASKSRLRSARAMLLQKELDDIQKESAPTATKLQQLKRQLIKNAYTEQLNAIIELGKKMQIIGEHGKELLEHIDLPASNTEDGRKTEDILQSARITLENWDQMIMVNPATVVVHPPPPPPRSLSDLSVENLAVSETGSDSESDSDDDEFVPAPSTPLKAKPSIALTISADDLSLSKNAHVNKNDQEEENAETPRQEKLLATPFGSTLAPKLTLSPSKPTSSPSLPPRNTDWASEAAEALASVQAAKKLEDIIKEEDTSALEAETLRRLEELEMKRALELSLAEAQKPVETSDEEDLKLTAEELRFVMGDVAPKRSTKAVKRRTRAPEADGSSSPAISVRASARRANKESGVSVDTDKAVSDSAHTDTESEQDLATPKATKPARVVRGPQGAVPEGNNRLSQQGPRPWVADEGDQGEEDAGAASETSTVEVDGPVEELASASHVVETMGEGPRPSSVSKKSKSIKVTKHMETLGSEPERPLESMGPEPERPLESMGPEPERLLESMGEHDGPDNHQQQQQQHQQQQQQQQQQPPVQRVTMPQMPSLDGIREQKLMEKRQHEQQQLAAFGVSPEMRHLQLQNSPMAAHQSPMQGQGHASPGQVYASPVMYTPSTAYVPQTPKQQNKNRLSGSHVGQSPGSSPVPQYQQQYPQQQQQQQQQYYRQQQQQQLQDFYYSPFEQEYQQQQYQQYHQQLKEQQRQLQRQRVDSMSSVSSATSTGSSATLGIAPLGWNLPGMPAPQITDHDVRYYNDVYRPSQQQQQQQQQQYHERTHSAAGSVHGGDSSGAPSPSPSHISLIPDNTGSPSPVMANIAPGTPGLAKQQTGTTTAVAADSNAKNKPLAPSPDDYKVEVK
ncbi:hypothetical protein BGZ99_003097 [Dissophora globulifera]|uniref:Eisosome component PIL1-domain-containing protein n=1 Tax=Dissophora globulifera TaxID=979702 RepID=A0A9P6V059_9FUNG|nr:hypothetical protein BGZ99_003097 [Dissophora globulifera]